MGNKQINPDEICAVIVSFNPDEKIVRNIEALMPQVGECIVVDNGSESGLLKNIEQYDRVTVVYQGENKGIASALNKGTQLCIQKGFNYILTMDQDTVLQASAVTKLADAITQHDVPSVGINWDGKIKEDKKVNYLITSGNLVLAKAMSEIGLFDETFFIDSVDFDFSLRLLDHGYAMYKVADALADHSLGEATEAGNYRTHSVNRYYYIFRNHFYFIHKHWENHKLFCLKKQLALLLDLFRILLFDSERVEKFKMLRIGYNAYKQMLSE